MNRAPLPRMMQRWVDYIGNASRPVEFQEVFEAVGRKQGGNVMRHLKRRGLVLDVVKKYHSFEPYTGPRISKYILSTEGLEHFKKAES